MQNLGYESSSKKGYGIFVVDLIIKSELKSAPRRRRNSFCERLCRAKEWESKTEMAPT